MPSVHIGSSAFNKFRSPRPVNDIDLIADFDSAQNILRRAKCTSIYPINKGKTLFGRNKDLIIEIEIAWPGSTGHALLKYLDNPEMGYAPLDVLYALKMSHRYLRNSPHFLKTMGDIREMRKLEAKIPADLENWFKRRERETYDYSHPNLNQNKEGFFSGDGVTYIYDHDSIHEAVALYDRPVYLFYQKDGSDVLCDKAKWDALDKSLKLAAVYEESCVLAIERSLVPYPGVKTPTAAYIMALQKVCTSITSGWFREFAWENYNSLLGFFTYQSDYFTKFQTALILGRIKPYE